MRARLIFADESDGGTHKTLPHKKSPKKRGRKGGQQRVLKIIGARKSTKHLVGRKGGSKRQETANGLGRLCDPTGHAEKNHSVKGPAHCS